MFRERLSRYRHGGPTVWLAGDVHKPDQVCLGNLVHVITGRFGTDTAVRSSLLSRQAKIIIVSDDRQTLVSTLEYRVTTHHDQAHVGDWQLLTSKKVPRLMGDEEISASGRSDIIEAVSGIGAETDNIARSGNVQTLDDDLERELLLIIEKKKLYRLGRFMTSSSLVSLGWVSIGPLMNYQGITELIVTKMVNWICSKVTDLGAMDKESVVVFGVDCWGAVLAAQISVKLGCRNYCVAARAKGKYHSHREKVSKTLVDAFAKSKAAFFVADVVATGGTINHLHKELVNLSEKPTDPGPPEPQCYLLSIFADSTNLKQRNMSFSDDCIATCCSLRIPILAPGALPNERVLPAVISFS